MASPNVTRSGVALDIGEIDGKRDMSPIRNDFPGQGDMSIGTEPAKDDSSFCLLEQMLGDNSDAVGVVLTK